MLSRPDRDHGKLQGHVWDARPERISLALALILNRNPCHGRHRDLHQTVVPLLCESQGLAEIERTDLPRDRHHVRLQTRAGKPIARGALYTILRNRLYRGEVCHGDKVFAGQHNAIIERELWDEVQETLAANRARHTNGSDCKNPSLLSGLLFDSDGHRLTPPRSSQDMSGNSSTTRKVAL